MRAGGVASKAKHDTRWELASCSRELRARPAGGRAEGGRGFSRAHQPECAPYCASSASRSHQSATAQPHTRAHATPVPKTPTRGGAQVKTVPGRRTAREQRRVTVRREKGMMFAGAGCERVRARGPSGYCRDPDVTPLSRPPSPSPPPPRGATRRETRRGLCGADRPTDRPTDLRFANLLARALLGDSQMLQAVREQLDVGLGALSRVLRVEHDRHPWRRALCCDRRRRCAMETDGGDEKKTGGDETTTEQKKKGPATPPPPPSFPSCTARSSRTRGLSSASRTVRRRGLFRGATSWRADADS